MNIKTFGQLSKSDVGVAGGKGASLGEMTQAGIPVPPGFVILASAFDEFLAATDLTQEVEAQLDKVNYEDISSIERASRVIHALIHDAKFPENLKKEVMEAYRGLENPPASQGGVASSIAEDPLVKGGSKGGLFVAVRSSATAEDSSVASWAGELESYLNTTEETLLDNIKKCWASLFTPRAIVYRNEKGMRQTRVSVAVVVQKMVQSEVSGICFTVHPVTRDVNQMIIEACWGLGEYIVGGIVTPDSYVIDKRDGSMVDLNVSEQEIMLVRGNSGNDKVDVPVEIREKQKIDSTQIVKLADICASIERHYGFPCDIEWAMEKGELYVVQSRPITTLCPDMGLGEINGQKWMYLIERKRSFFCDSLMAEAIAKPYLKGMGFFYTIPRILYDDGRWFANADDFTAVAKELDRRMAEDPSFVSRTLEDSLVIIEDGVKRVRGLVEASNEMLHARLENYVETVRELLSFMVFPHIIERSLSSRIKKGIGGIFPDPDAALFRLIPASEKGFFEKFEHELLSVLAASDEERLKTEIDQGTFVLSNNPALKDLFDRYQWLNDLDFKLDLLTESAFVERISLIVGRAAQILEEKDSESKRWEEEEDAYRSSIKDRAILDLIDVAQRYVWFRTYRMDMLVKSLYEAREIFHAISRELGISAREVLELDTEEIKQALSNSAVGVQEIVSGRSGRVAFYYDGEKLNRLVADEADKVNAFKSESIDADEIKGLSASTGKATGKVVLVKSVEDIGKAQKGDVLVTTMTRPNFIVAMEKTVAFVTDEGGITCHAAIVAREMNKPCIIGTKVATKVLKDGDEVEVDAEKGVVRVIKRA